MIQTNRSIMTFSALCAVIAIMQIMNASAQSETGSTNTIFPPQVSAEFPYQSRFVHILGSQMHYVEQGTGDPIVFIYGNPSSSYLWRNVIPYVAHRGRAIAMDLIGMGQSGKPDIDYNFEDNYRYVEGFINNMGLQDITLVVHDWGAAIGFEFARRHPHLVKAIAFMEGVLPPAFPQPSYEAMGEEMGNMFRAFKDPEQGVQMIIHDNVFIEQILPKYVIRTMSTEEQAAYAAPFREESNRQPMLAWPREFPIAGNPRRNVDTLGTIATIMEKSDLPMLLFYASPGVLVPPLGVSWYTQRIKNLETAFVGQGLHFIQEDQPEAIGRAIAEWLRRIQ